LVEGALHADAVAFLRERFGDALTLVDGIHMSLT
jgi:hypothetical protein